MVKLGKNRMILKWQILGRGIDFLITWNSSKIFCFGVWEIYVSINWMIELWWSLLYANTVGLELFTKKNCSVTQFKMTKCWTCYWFSSGGEIKIARICWLCNLTDWLLDMLLVLFGGGIKLYKLISCTT